MINFHFDKFSIFVSYVGLVELTLLTFRKLNTKEKFVAQLNKLSEKFSINTEMIESYLSLENKTNIGLKPPKKLINDIIKCVSEKKSPAKRENMTSDPYFKNTSAKSNNHSVVERKE